MNVSVLTVFGGTDSATDSGSAVFRHVPSGIDGPNDSGAVGDSSDLAQIFWSDDMSAMTAEVLKKLRTCWVV